MIDLGISKLALIGAVALIVIGPEKLPRVARTMGMLLGKARAYAWACFVVNLYFIKGVLAAFDPARSLLGWIEVLLSVSLFCAALMYPRWRFQYDRILAGER